METIFMQFGLVLLITLGVSFVMKIMKQPLVIGYILSGIVVGPFVLNFLNGENSTLMVFSEMGIAFLLFIVGLQLSPKVIKEVGKISLVTGVGQIIFTSLIGFLIALVFGFNPISSLYIAVALTFSSTIIIMKLLADKDALDKLYGKISIGFLLVQDLVAIFMLVLITSFSSGGEGSLNFISTILNGVIILMILIPISYYILPKLSNFFAQSQELLFLFSIAWGFGLAVLFSVAGLSIEVGALIAGIMLSMSPYSSEITSKLKPLRDFFIITFFILLGSQMVFGDLGNLIIPALVFSIFVLVGNPIIVILLMSKFGYSNKTGFLAGLTVAQISEFSLILVSLGVKSGALTQEILSFVTLIGLVTIAGSTYMIIYSDWVYKQVSPILMMVSKKKYDKSIKTKTYKYLLLGYNRIGFSIIKSFDKITDNYLVVDYDPKVIELLQSKNINCIYGDVEDLDILESLNISKSRVIVSTIPELSIGILILKTALKGKSKPVVILTERQINDALELYQNGADYVILPHFLGGEYTASLIERAKDNKSIYELERKKDILLLEERKKHGHEHPKIEREQNRSKK